MLIPTNVPSVQKNLESVVRSDFWNVGETFLFCLFRYQSGDSDKSVRYRQYLTVNEYVEVLEGETSGAKTSRPYPRVSCQRGYQEEQEDHRPHLPEVDTPCGRELLIPPAPTPTGAVARRKELTATINHHELYHLPSMFFKGCQWYNLKAVHL